MLFAIFATSAILGFLSEAKSGTILVTMEDVRGKKEDVRGKMEERMSDEQMALWYNDQVIYPDKVRINLYYLKNYSFLKDIQMIFCTVLGKKMWYNGEMI